MPKTQTVKRNYKRKYSKKKINVKTSLTKEIENFEQQVIGISLGIDCYVKIGLEKSYQYVKTKLKIIKQIKNNKTNFQPTFPFDWIVTYKGVSDIIKKGKNGFDNLFENKSLIIIEKIDNNNTNITDIKYGISFLHDGKNLSLIKDKYIRRLERLISLIEYYNENNKQIVFFRKSHKLKHHHEVDTLNSKIKEKIDKTDKIIIKNDIDDSIELEKYLSSKYPKLNYFIVIFLICEKCFNKNNRQLIENKINISKSSKIIIHYTNNFEEDIKKSHHKSHLQIKQIKQTNIEDKLYCYKLYCYMDKINYNKKITKTICSNN